MRIYLVITEFDSSQYCEPDIYMEEVANFAGTIKFTNVV